MKNEKYIKLLKEINKKAYAPYSNFKVSAVLVTKSGKVFTGTNVENLSYGATMCAERVAIFSAVSSGETEFETIYLYSTDHLGKHNLTPPCGLCRQVMSEFSMDMDVVMISDERTLTKTVKELIPLHFDNDFLPKK